MRNARIRALAVIGIVLAGGGIGYSLLTHYPKTAVFHVQLTESGFSPQVLSISKGDKVVFSTARKEEFWPASDLHPTHDLYPEFDPKRPIAASQTWEFRFDRVGEWTYHDHLDPFFRGTIRVTEQKSASANVRADPKTACRGYADGARIQCWNQLIRQTLEEKDLDAAFAALDAFIRQNPSLVGDCHGFTHQIGQEAYALFNQKRDFALSPKTSYCGYGFYHGFMEALVHTTNDIAQARTFCEYADAKLKPFIADAGGACLHGIGHGSVEDTPDPAVWGDAQAILAPALALCEGVASDAQELFRCGSGAFNALEIITDEGKYDLSANVKDPFAICRAQPERYKRACYTQFLVSAMQVAKNDFSRTARFVDTIPEDAYAKETLLGLAAERARLNENDFAGAIQWCRALSDRFLISCITGFAEGLLKYGPPESEYAGAMEFCASSLLKEDERRSCFRHALSLLRNFYTAEKSRALCESAKEQYRWNACIYE